VAASEPSGRPLLTEGEPSRSPMRRKVVASLLWQGSASLVGQAISWLVTLIVIRLLSPSDYGLVAMAGLSISFLMLVGDLGVGPVVVQAPALQRPQLQALFAVALWAYLLGAIVAFASAPVAAAFFAEPRLISIVRALSLSFVFAGLYAVPQALVLRTLEFDRNATIEVLATLVSSVVALTLALGGWGAWSLVGATLAIHAFRAAAFQIVRPCLFGPFPSLAVLRDMVHFGGLVTVDRILWFGYTNLDIAIAGRALGGALVGVYSVALSLASMPFDKVMSIVTQVSFSAFSRIQDDRESLRRGMLQALESVSLLAFPAAVGMATIAPEALAIFVGPKWADAVIPFQILCLSLPFRALGLLFTPALFGTGQPRVAVENNAITLVTVAVALIVGVQWGVVGLCVGWLAGYVPIFCVTAYRALATLEMPVGRAVAAMGIPLAATLVMGGGVVGARILVAEALPPAAALASLSLLGAGIYGALMAALRPQALRSLWTLGQGK
jgi:O-antigen/teichoic acid export membrane protein